MEVMNLIEQPIKVTEWQQTYTYDSGIHSGANTCVPSVCSKGVMEEDEACGRQYTLKKTTTYTQGVPQSQGWGPEPSPWEYTHKKIRLGHGGRKVRIREGSHLGVSNLRGEAELLFLKTCLV